MYAVSRNAKAAIIPPARKIPEFKEPPSACTVRIVQGNYVSYCGAVACRAGSVFVAVTRNSCANRDVGYEPPALDYLKGLMNHPEVLRANLSCRLPADIEELYALTQK